MATTRTYDFQVMDNTCMIIGTLKAESQTAARAQAETTFGTGSIVKRVTATEATNIQAGLELRAKMAEQKAAEDKKTEQPKERKVIEVPAGKRKYTAEDAAKAEAKKTDKASKKAEKGEKPAKESKDSRKVKVDLTGVENPEAQTKTESKAKRVKKWYGATEGNFPAPSYPIDDPNQKQLETYKALRNMFLEADNGVKKATEISKEFENGILMMHYTTQRKDGTKVSRITGIYPGGRPAAWGKRPNGSPYIFRGTKDVVKYGFSVEA